MPRRDIAQAMRLIGDAFERRQRARKRCDKFRGFCKLAVVQSDARIGMMQIGLSLGAVFFQLRTKSIERVRQSDAAGAGPRAAQHRAFERSDRALAMLSAERAAADA